MAKRMDISEGHATHIFCNICKGSSVIDNKVSEKWRCVRAHFDTELKRWYYDDTSGAGIMVCDACTVQGEPRE